MANTTKNVAKSDAKNDAKSDAKSDAKNDAKGDTKYMSRSEATKRIREQIKGIQVAMLTTVDANGALHSRPMATQDMQDDGTLWFYTYADAPKVDSIEHDQQVTLSYVDEGDNCYVSLSGTAQLVRDRAQIDHYWKPFLQAWFPKGKDDPNLALLKVTIDEAQYWDGPSNFIGEALVIVKDIITGSHSQGGTNEKIDIQ